MATTKELDARVSVLETIEAKRAERREKLSKAIDVVCDVATDVLLMMLAFDLVAGE